MKDSEFMEYNNHYYNNQFNFVKPITRKAKIKADIDKQLELIDLKIFNFLENNPNFDQNLSYGIEYKTFYNVDNAYSTSYKTVFPHLYKKLLELIKDKDQGVDCFQLKNVIDAALRSDTDTVIVYFLNNLKEMTSILENLCQFESNLVKNYHLDSSIEFEEVLTALIENADKLSNDQINGDMESIIIQDQMALEQITMMGEVSAHSAAD